MNLNDLDRMEYRDIPLLKMVDNRHGDLPFFARKYINFDFNTKLHRHEYMQINYVCQGQGKHCLNNHDFDIVKGDIFIIPPYIPHRIMRYDNSSIEIFEFEFEPEFINRNFDGISNIESFFDFAYIEPFLVSESKVKPRLNMIGGVQVQVENILEEVFKEYNERKSGYILLVRSLLLKLLIVLGRELTRELEGTESRVIYDCSKNAVLNAVKYIKEHYIEDIWVDEVAQKFTISPSYFRYLFKIITSKTFTEYVNDLRISRSMELLRDTDMRVIDVCYESGFKNINHFNRMFRQQTGKTPLMYRNITC